MTTASDRQPAHLRENPYPKADVVLVRDNHWFEGFNAYNDTDADRGDAITRALAACQDGDTLLVGYGVFDLGTNRIDLSLGGTGTVHLVGMGQRLTEIRSQSYPLALGSIIHLGLVNCEVANLTVNANSTVNTAFQAPIGVNSVAGESAFTNAVLRSVRILGGSDGLYVSHTSACSLSAFNVEGYTKYDVVAVFPPSTGPNHTLGFYNCRFRCVGPNGTGNGQTRCINSRIGTSRFFGCEFYAENGGAGTGAETIAITVNGGNVEVYGGSIAVNGDNTNTRGVKVGTTGTFLGVGVSINAVGTNSVSANGFILTGGTAELVSSRVVSSGTGTPLDLVRSGGTLTVSGTKYDGTKTSGTITQGLWQGVTPTAAGLNTLST